MGKVSCCGPTIVEVLNGKEISNGPTTAEALKSKEKSVVRGAKNNYSEVKLLLLGTLESGKSTIAKQMKVIHCSGFPEQERIRYKEVIYYNVITSMKTLISESRERYKLEVQDRNAAARICALPDTSRVLTGEICRDVKSLWNDLTIRQTYQKSSDFYIMDNVSFYFNSIDRLGADGYVPTEQDVLNSRVTTTGIREIEFDISDVHFRMIDVGGARTERRRWIHCFENVTAVLFCVALSEYDQRLLEDEDMMRMKESLNLFEEVCHNPWFSETPIILLLNKKDIFVEKIRRVPLNVCFPEYTGENDFSHAARYIQDKFADLAVGCSRPIYPHFTCATDTSYIAVWFQAVRDIILRAQLRKNGLL